MNDGYYKWSAASIATGGEGRVLHIRSSHAVDATAAGGEADKFAMCFGDAWFNGFKFISGGNRVHLGSSPRHY